MLDLDAIERANAEMMKTDYGDNYAPKWLHRQVIELIAELRKCRAAMEEAVNLVLDDESNVVDAVAALNEALRGAK